MTDLRLLGRASSSNVQKVMFLLGELGVPYTQEDYGRQFGNTDTPEYRAMNPTGKVPTLVDGAVVVWESHAILRYLATSYASPLYPGEPALRSQVDRWMDWTLASLNPLFLAGFRDAKKEAADRNPDTGPALAAEMAVIEAQLTRGPWVAGATMSLADIALGPVLRRCIAFPLDLPFMPHVKAWCARLADRPTFQTATAAG